METIDIIFTILITLITYFLLPRNKKYRIKKITYNSGDVKYIIEESNRPFIWSHHYIYKSSSDGIVVYYNTEEEVREVIDNILEEEMSEKLEKYLKSINRTEIIDHSQKKD